MKTLHRGEDGVLRVITDGAQRQLEPALGGLLSCGGAPAELGLCEFLEVVIYVNRTGITKAAIICCPK